MVQVAFKQDFKLQNVITKIVSTVIVLYAGNLIINSVATTLTCTSGVFNSGLSFLGFAVNSTTNASAPCYNTLTGAVSTTGILSVIGVLAGAWIVMDFISVKW